MKYGFVEQDNYQRYVCNSCGHEHVYNQSTNFYDHTTVEWPVKVCPKCNGVFKPGLGKDFNATIESIVQKLNDKVSMV